MAKQNQKSKSEKVTEESSEQAPDNAPAQSFALPGWLEGVIVVAALSVFLLLSLTSMRHKNATFDEGAHIPAAYTYVAQHDFRMNPEHPPLSKLLAGFAQKWFAAPKADTNHQTWKEANQYEFGLKYLYEWNDAGRVIYAARVPGILLALLLGLLIYGCARRFYGWPGGCLAVLLFAFNPDMLAHAQLVTTDLPLACFMFAAVYAFYRALQKLSLVNALLAGLALGLCLVAKFSGVLVLPMLVLLGVAYAFSPSVTEFALRGSAAVRSLRTSKEKLLAAGGLLLAAGVIGLVVIWASYGFRYAMSSEPEVSQKIKWQQYFDKETLPTVVIELAHNLKLVPEAYSYGFLYALESTEKRFAYLGGEYSTKGWWYYFIVTFLFKTPLGLIALLGLAAFLLRRHSPGWAAEAMLLVPVGVYLLVTLASNLNIGHRHLLPIYPFLIVFAARVGKEFTWPRLSRLGMVCAALLAWNVLATLWVTPNYLSYFNELAGGPAGGSRLLADSNIDWGQDLKALAAYRAAHPEGELYLSYFGTALPEYYGLQAKFLPGLNSQMAQKTRDKEVVNFNQIPSGALVAVSVTHLTGTYVRNYRLPGTEEVLQRLRGIEPLARIGYSINVYRMP